VSARLATALLACGLAACGSTMNAWTHVLDVRPATTGASSTSSASEGTTYLGLPLRTGQIVFTESPDATSFVFSLVPAKFFDFTHAAIVSVEDGEAYVYEVSGEIVTLPLHERVMDNVAGEVHRRPFYEHVAPNLYAEVYDPPAGVDGTKVAAFARAEWQKKTPFDATFDYDDHSKLFCTELVALALEAGGAPKVALQPTNTNPSLRTGMKWLGVPLETALPAGVFLDPARYVGALGQFPSRAAAYAYFEAKREIHRRFTPDQRLGFVFTLHGTGKVDMRPEISNFAVKAIHLFDATDAKDLPAPGDPRIRAAVRALATNMFGPFAGDAKEGPGVADADDAPRAAEPPARAAYAMLPSTFR
jgi:hypothetical protein